MCVILNQLGNRQLTTSHNFAVIVMTTNLGANILVRPDQAMMDEASNAEISEQAKEAVMAVVANTFAPEFGVSPSQCPRFSE